MIISYPLELYSLRTSEHSFWSLHHIKDIWYELAVLEEKFGSTLKNELREVNRNGNMCWDEKKMQSVWKENIEKLQITIEKFITKDIQTNLMGFEQIFIENNWTSCLSVFILQRRGRQTCTRYDPVHLVDFANAIYRRYASERWAGKNSRLSLSVSTDRAVVAPVDQRPSSQWLDRRDVHQILKERVKFKASLCSWNHSSHDYRDSYSEMDGYGIWNYFWISVSALIILATLIVCVVVPELKHLYGSLVRRCLASYFCHHVVGLLVSIDWDVDSLFGQCLIGNFRM